MCYYHNLFVTCQCGLSRDGGMAFLIGSGSIRSNSRPSWYVGLFTAIQLTQLKQEYYWHDYYDSILPFLHLVFFLNDDYTYLPVFDLFARLLEISQVVLGIVIPIEDRWFLFFRRALRYKKQSEEVWNSPKLLGFALRLLMAESCTTLDV